MKKILSQNTKAVVSVGVIIIMLLAVNIGMGSRTINNTSDTVSRQITLYSTATSANVQDAIESMGNKSGIVTLSGGMNISVASTIQLYDHVELDMNGAWFWNTANVCTVYMHPGSKIHGGYINVTGVTFTKECINISGVDDHSAVSNAYPTKIYDMCFKSASQRGYAIHFFIPNTAGDHQIGGCMINDIKTSYFNTSYYFDNRWATVGAGGWINGNFFTNLNGKGDTIFMNLENTVRVGTASTWTAIDGNIFCNIDYSPVITVSHVGLSIDGDFNSFKNVMFWDSGKFSNCSVFFRNGAENNFVDGPGGISASLVKDFGDYNGYMTTGYDSSSARAGSRFYGLNITEFNRYQPGTTGIKFYQTAASNPYTYFYGFNGATRKWAAFRVESDQDFYITTEAGNILLTPDQGAPTNGIHNVTIDDILKLVPRTTTPSPLSEGQIWVNGTSHHIYCYLNGVSVQLDN